MLITGTMILQEYTKSNWNEYERKLIALFTCPMYIGGITWSKEIPVGMKGVMTYLVSFNNMFYLHRVNLEREVANHRGENNQI